MHQPNTRSAGRRLVPPSATGLTTSGLDHPLRAATAAPMWVDDPATPAAAHVAAGNQSVQFAGTPALVVTPTPALVAPSATVPPGTLGAQVAAGQLAAALATLTTAPLGPAAATAPLGLAATTVPLGLTATSEPLGPTATPAIPAASGDPLNSGAPAVPSGVSLNPGAPAGAAPHSDTVRAFAPADSGSHLRPGAATVTPMDRSVSVAERLTHAADHLDPILLSVVRQCTTQRQLDQYLSLCFHCHARGHPRDLNGKSSRRTDGCAGAIKAKAAAQAAETAHALKRAAELDQQLEAQRAQRRRRFSLAE